MPVETLGIDQWIWETLSNDTALAAIVGARVYSDVAPATATFPFVTFSEQSSTDVRTASGQNRIMIDSLYVIRGIVTDTSFNVQSQAIAERIDALFHASQGGNANGTVVFTSHREQSFRLAEQQAGKSFRHLGGIYRVYAQ